MPTFNRNSHDSKKFFRKPICQRQFFRTKFLKFFSEMTILPKIEKCPKTILFSMPFDEFANVTLSSLSASSTTKFGGLSNTQVLQTHPRISRIWTPISYSLMIDINLTVKKLRRHFVTSIQKEFLHYIKLWIITRVSNHYVLVGNEQ